MNWAIFASSNREILTRVLFNSSTMLKSKTKKMDLLFLVTVESLVAGLLTMTFLGGSGFGIDIVAKDGALVEAIEPLLLVL